MPGENVAVLLVCTKILACARENHPFGRRGGLAGLWFCTAIWPAGLYAVGLPPAFSKGSADLDDAPSLPYPIIDMRNRPAFLHDFYGATRGTPEFEVVKWLNTRTFSRDPEHFVGSQDEAAYIAEIRAAGISAAVVIGRDTPAIQNDNDEIASLAGRHDELIGVGSVDPNRIGSAGAAAEIHRAMTTLGLKAINLEPGFGTPARHFDDAILLPLYDTLQTLNAPVFLMTGPTTPDLSFNNPDAIARVARAFPRLRLVVHHGAWPRAADIIGVAFRYENVTIVPDMYIFQPGGSLYVEAANGALSDQIAFGSSFPFRAMAQSVQDYAALGFRPDVLKKVFHTNASRLLGLDA